MLIFSLVVVNAAKAKRILISNISMALSVDINLACVYAPFCKAPRKLKVSF